MQPISKDWPYCNPTVGRVGRKVLTILFLHVGVIQRHAYLSMRQPLRGLEDLSNICACAAVVAGLGADGSQSMPLTERRRLVLRHVHLLINVQPAHCSSKSAADHP